MNRVIRVLCFSILCMASWAMTENRVLHDKISVIVNKHVITEGDVNKYVEAYASLSDNKEYINDPEFRAYIKSLMVINYMMVDFAERNGLLLTPEEEVNVLTHFMENQDLTYSDFQEYAENIGVSSVRLKKVICSGTQEDKVGMAVIRPSLEVTEDELVHARHQFIDDNALYKMKSWTIDLESGESIENVKNIKHVWAESGNDPLVGEVLDLGWKKRSDLPELFLKAIEGVSPGNLVGPIQSPFGYHLIWFEGEKIPEMPKEDALRNAVLYQKYTIKFAEWKKELQQYNIVIYK